MESKEIRRIRVGKEVVTGKSEDKSRGTNTMKLVIGYQLYTVDKLKIE